MNRVAGRLYGQDRLDALRKYLDRNNVDVFLNSTENKFIAHSVGRHQMYLPPNPTYYEVYHELQHYRHLRGVGYARFSRTSEALREQYVYDQLRLNTNLWRNVFNDAERNNAFLYILLKGGNPMSTPMRGFP
jgi:zincin-like metallopeptidase toxin 4 of polymorphic toxin system